MAALRKRVEEMQRIEADLLASREMRLSQAEALNAASALAVAVLAGALIVVLVMLAWRYAATIRHSEERLATTFASIGDAVLTTDGKGRIERMNAVAERLTGWTAAAAGGRKLTDVFVIVNETTRATVESPVERVLREGGIVGLANHTVLIARDGSQVAIEDSAAPIGADIHGRDGVVLVFRDATHTRALERSREASERRFRQMADGMPQIVYVADERGEVVYVNRRLEEYTGLAGSAAFDGDRNAIHPDDRDALATAWAAAQQARSPMEASFRMKGASGEWRWFLTRAIAIQDDSSGPLFWYGTSTDINEQVEAHEALALADRRKDEFVATLAHELRNPLAPIRNAVLRLAPADSESRTWAVEVIDRQVRTMAALLDDLLDIARITRGTLELQKHSVSLRSVFDGAIETAHPLLQARAHVLSVSLPETEIRLTADPIRLTQVFANLLTNAAKYTDPGGRIQMSGALDAGRITVVVSDNGIGLDADALTYIFEMFSQVSGAKDRADGGLGIGLALVRGLVALHGGTVVASSRGRAQGSEFRVELPEG
jgi:PAS domain S-box-containing protein